MNHRQHSEAEIQQMLKRYLDGSLSNEHKRLLERYASEDPMLMEALEGYIANGDTDYTPDIKQLKEAIVAPRPASKVSYLPWMRWAASIVGLGIISVMTYQFFTAEPDERDLIVGGEITEVITTAENRNDAEVAEDLPAPEAAIEPSVAQESLLNTSNEEAMMLSESNEEEEILYSTKVLNPEGEEPDVAAELDNVDVQNKIRRKQNATTNHAPQQEEAFNGEEDLAMEVDVVSMDGDLVNLKDKSKRIIGVKVVDENGQALIGSSVVAGKQGVYSNLDGYATLEIDTSTKLVESNYVGYQDVAVPLVDTVSFYTLVHPENELLDEVTLRDIEAVDEPIAAPEGGWNQFELYVEQQLLSVKTTMDKYPRGVIEVKFRINENGDVSDLNVIQSIDPVIDRKVKNIIKMYGKWMTNPPNSDMYTTFKYTF